MSTEHKFALPPGSRLRQYIIERLLGHGGFGLTYLAEDTNLNRKVAIKEMLPVDFAVREPDGTTVVARSQQDEPNLEWARRRFVEEGRTLAALEHPSILPVYEIFELHGTAYLVTAFVEGSNFEEWLRDGRTLRQEDLLRMADSLLDALRLVHEQGFLHRDIKPQNILINAKTSRPVLIDFGNARMATGQKTSNMTAVLTRGYAPFEQYQSKARQGPYTDVYALGAVFYRAISGAAPTDALERLDEDKIQVLSEQRIPGYTREFLSTIDKALNMSRESRWQNCEEWKVALRDGHASVPSPPPPSPPPPQPLPARFKMLLALTGIALLALCGVVIGALKWNRGVQNISGGATPPHNTLRLEDDSSTPLPKTTPPPRADSIYFALIPGNEWTTDAVGISNAGGVAKGIGHYKMEGRQERGNKTFAVRHDRLSVGPVHIDEMNYYRTDSEGLHTIFGASEALGEQMEVPFPIKPGNQWRVNTQFGPADYTVVGFETVIVPAGAYENCCHLRSQSAIGVSDTWLAPGIGGVKSNIVSSNGSTLSQSLTAFKPAHP